MGRDHRKQKRAKRKAFKKARRLNRQTRKAARQQERQEGYNNPWVRRSQALFEEHENREREFRRLREERTARERQEREAAGAVLRARWEEMRALQARMEEARGRDRGWWWTPEVELNVQSDYIGGWHRRGRDYDSDARHFREGL